QIQRTYHCPRSLTSGNDKTRHPTINQRARGLRKQCVELVCDLLAAKFVLHVAHAPGPVGGKHDRSSAVIVTNEGYKLRRPHALVHDIVDSDRESRMATLMHVDLFECRFRARSCQNRFWPRRSFECTGSTARETALNEVSRQAQRNA